MPGRTIPLVTGEIYHIFNRGINKQPTFTNKKEYKRALNTIQFYRYVKPPMSLSKFLKLEDKKQNDIIDVLKQRKKLVEIYCFCFMPNHFHFLVRQREDKGISIFLSNLQNSYTKFFNTKHNRDGSLFSDQFKAVRIETDEQLTHVSRYIHLNPYTGYVVKSLEELENYYWSSFPEYLKASGQFIDIYFVLSFFKNQKEYKQFIYDQADYQRELKEIEHLMFE